jgi:hypothetical protein
MNNMYPGCDLEGDARESADLKIAETMPQPRKLEMPSMSEQERSCASTLLTAWKLRVFGS